MLLFFIVSFCVMFSLSYYHWCCIEVRFCIVFFLLFSLTQIWIQDNISDSILTYLSCSSLLVVYCVVGGHLLMSYLWHTMGYPPHNWGTDSLAPESGSCLSYRYVSRRLTPMSGLAKWLFWFTSAYAWRWVACITNF